MASSILGLKLEFNSPKRLDSVRSGMAVKKREFVWVKAMGGGGGAKYKGTARREKQLAEMIESKVMEAKEACEDDGSSDGCKVAWDEVEEVSQAKAHLRRKLEMEEDPLISFCSDNPDTDECSSVYDDH